MFFNSHYTLKICLDEWNQLQSSLPEHGATPLAGRRCCLHVFAELLSISTSFSREHPALPPQLTVRQCHRQSCLWRGNGSVGAPPRFVQAGFLQKPWWSDCLSQGDGDASGIEMEGGMWWWFFLLDLFSPPPPKKKTTLSYSPWIFSKESQHHCGGPETILLLHPSGSLQISKIRWAQE